MIQPISDYVLVELTTAESAVLTPGNKVETQQGKVISIGEGRKSEDGSYTHELSPLIKKGTIVYFQRFSTEGTEFKVEGKKLALVNFNNIIGLEE